MAINTGNDADINKQMTMFYCGVMSSLDPDTGEQVSGTGGYMVSGTNGVVSMGVNKNYSCTFDASGLHNHGFLILGNGGSDHIDYPYDLR